MTASVTRLASFYARLSRRQKHRGEQPVDTLLVDARQVRLLSLRGGEIAWQDSESHSGPDSIGTAVAEVLRRAASSGYQARGRKMRFEVGLSPRFVRIKLLEGLPSHARSSGLLRFVEENAERFFLHGGRCLLRVDVGAGGEQAWGAAYDREVVSQLVAVFAAQETVLLRIVPTVLALGTSLGTGSLTWYESGRFTAARFIDGEVVDVQVRASEADAPQEISLSTANEGAAADRDLASGYDQAAALGVSGYGRREGLALPCHSSSQGSNLRGSRSILAVRLLCIALALAGLAIPGISAERSARRSEQALLELSDHRVEAMFLLREASELQTSFTAVGEFAENRRSMSYLLSRIATSLPEGTILESLRLDESGGSAVAFGRNASAVAASLVRSGVAEDAEMVGSLTRHPLEWPARAERLGEDDQYGGRQGFDAERVSVRFRLSRDSMPDGWFMKYSAPSNSPDRGR